MNPEKIEPITIKKAKEILLQTMRLYFSKNRKGEYQMDRRRTRPLYLMGAAGIGKTEIVRQAAEESGVAFLSYSVTHHTRQSLIGLPCLKEEWIGGELVSMTEYTMSEILAEIYQTIEETGKAEGVLLLDECNCISESLRPIMLQLLQEKVFGRHSIPDGWLLVLTGNPAEY
ncbi:MAG: AAA family ATPase, partial [Bacillota bacterium]|nr:AAA family ATPase [Bacillota bacterium]